MNFSENQESLEVIQEKRPILARLKYDGLDIVRSMQVQSWFGYYSLLHGPIYPVLVKEFWKNAKISDNGNIIWSKIYDLPIAITISSIVEVTGCIASGLTIDDFQTDLSLIEKFRALQDSSTSLEPTCPETLLPTPKTWFRFSLTNLRPRATARSTLSHDDRIFIYLLTNHFKINLPKTIFDHLKYSLEITRTRHIFYIPYGRILSEIFIKEGIVEAVKKIGLEHSLIEERCERVNSVEEFDD